MDRFLLPNCPFCSKDILSVSFDETDHFRAIYNISPILPGHSLVIPKWHIESLMDLSDDEICEMMTFGRRVVKRLLKAFQAEAFNWTIQEGKEAGQSVSHLHLHLIPRQTNDLPNPGDWYPLLKESLNHQNDEIIDSDTRSRLTAEEMERIVNYLRAVHF